MTIRRQVLNVKTMRRAPKDSDKTPWQQPIAYPKWYTLFCCDCALCHQFQFRVGKDGTGHDRVQFRVRRANLYTQMKRKHKSEAGHIERLKKGECVRALVDGVYVINLTNGLRRGGAKHEKRKPRNAKTAPPIRPASKSPRQRKRGRA